LSNKKLKIINKNVILKKKYFMRIYTKKSIQNLPISIDQAWDFLSDPKNLKTITPDYMGFIIESGADRPMYAGQIIQYIVTPILGIKTKWVTEITHVIDKHYFVDEQRFGPYALWHHKHFIREIPGGVEMEDIIDYKVPMGILGQLVHPFLVKPKLDEIFTYRHAKLIELFGDFKS
jgi:ligand-binding SRPBCC domain-containing protein